MWRRQLKQPLDGAHGFDELDGDLFAINISFNTPELALITFEWAFAAVGKLVSGYVATLSTEVSAVVTLEWEFVAMGRSIRIFDLRKVGHGQLVQFLQWRHSITNFKID